MSLYRIKYDKYIYFDANVCDVCASVCHDVRASCVCITIKFFNAYELASKWLR